MTDLRPIYGEDYYRNIRKRRITPAVGTIQNLTDKQKKELSAKGHDARWKKPNTKKSKLPKRRSEV